jgi:hypothetical protein
MGVTSTILPVNGISRGTCNLYQLAVTLNVRHIVTGRLDPAKT